MSRRVRGAAEGRGTEGPRRPVWNDLEVAAGGCCWQNKTQSSHRITAGGKRRVAIPGVLVWRATLSREAWMPIWGLSTESMSPGRLPVVVKQEPKATEMARESTGVPGVTTRTDPFHVLRCCSESPPTNEQTSTSELHTIVHLKYVRGKRIVQAVQSHTPPLPNVLRVVKF